MKRMNVLRWSVANNVVELLLEDDLEVMFLKEARRKMTSVDKKRDFVWWFYALGMWRVLTPQSRESYCTVTDVGKNAGEVNVFDLRGEIMKNVRENVPVELLCFVSFLRALLQHCLLERTQVLRRKLGTRHEARDLKRSWMPMKACIKQSLTKQIDSAVSLPSKLAFHRLSTKGTRDYLLHLMQRTLRTCRSSEQ